MNVAPKDLKRLRRGCSNRQVRKQVEAALKAGARYRMTKSGIVLYGENGRSAVTHFTVSDGRGPKNLMRDINALELPQ